MSTTHDAMCHFMCTNLVTLKDTRLSVPEFGVIHQTNQPMIKRELNSVQFVYTRTHADNQRLVKAVHYKSLARSFARCRSGGTRERF